MNERPILVRLDTVRRRKPKKWRRCGKTSLHRLPAGPGVYMMFGIGASVGRPLEPDYIGSSINLRNRVCPNHSKWKFAHLIMFRETRLGQHLSIEHRLIRYFKPPLNQVGNPKQPQKTWIEALMGSKKSM
jgi:hypothetical protein